MLRLLVAILGLIADKNDQSCVELAKDVLKDVDKFVLEDKLGKKQL